jgi:hypothetical protein
MLDFEMPIREQPRSEAEFKLRHYQAAFLAFRPVAAVDAARGARRKERDASPNALPPSAAPD